MGWVVKYTESDSEFMDDVHGVARAIESGNLEAPGTGSPLVRALLYIADVGFEVWTETYLWFDGTLPMHGSREEAAVFATREEAELAAAEHNCDDDIEVVETQDA